MFDGCAHEHAHLLVLRALRGDERRDRARRRRQRRADWKIGCQRRILIRPVAVPLDVRSPAAHFAEVARRERRLGSSERRNSMRF